MPDPTKADTRHPLDAPPGGTVSAPEKGLMIRTVAADMTSYGGFAWPSSGPIECRDWSSDPVCGGGLHGLLDGVGDYSLLSDNPTARWLLVEINRADAVEINGKVKVPRGVVVYCGDMAGALNRVALEWRRIASESAHGSATSGDMAHAASQGYRAHASALGPHGTAACLGLGGRVKAGQDGTLVLTWWDTGAGRHRVVVGYVGEDGIEADTWYRVEDGALVAVEGEAP